MSFSAEVKEELVKQLPTPKHCQIAELAAILQYAMAVKKDEKGQFYIEMHEESLFPTRKCFTLLKKTFNIGSVAETPNCRCIDSEAVNRILMSIKYVEGSHTVSPLVVKSACCKRAFLRGAFLSIGSMSNPEKGYHLEFVCENIEQAGQIQDMLHTFDIEAKIVQRKRYQVVYIKESEGIVELLNVMGAHVALMNLENLRILKDMRNSINRRVNCEAANITKTVNAATKQIEDIQYIRDHYGFDNLSDNLREIAVVRLEYPEATLKELGECLEPKVGKSGVNHRLRKLSELADRLRS
ncbi:MAG: DNA-binding protein WhiA [Lachnospiraceae bacterium]|nr:DNA-binding protein WhiA [Lachnospiraceae bacterium]